MTIYADAHTDVRTSDVLAEVHGYRSPRHRRSPTKGLTLRSPWWLVPIVGGAVSLLLTLGTVSYAIPQIV